MTRHQLVELMRTPILFAVLTTYIAQSDRHPPVNMVRTPILTVRTYSQFVGTNVLRRRGHQSSALLHPATLKTILYAIPTERCSSASLSLTQSYYLHIWTQICLHMSGDENIMFNICQYFINHKSSRTWSILFRASYTYYKYATKTQSSFLFTPSP